ncbi:MAG: hypothetical protein ABIW76_22925 [Fibrobacteria bacterium]
MRFISLTFTVEENRIGRLDIYYGGQTGAVPAALGGLDSLRRLFMGITSVTSLPPEIGKLKRLDAIDIGSSAIGPTLPDEIGSLPNLKLLRVKGCLLKSLSPTLMRLKKLETVDFSNNAICHVDDSLKQWLLAISPHALDNQRVSGCTSSGIMDTQPILPHKTPKAGGRPGPRQGFQIEYGQTRDRRVTALGKKSSRPRKE